MKVVYLACSCWRDLKNKNYFECRFNLLTFSGTWDLLIEVVAALQNVEGGVRRQWLIDAVAISCVATYPSTVGARLNFLQLLT